MTAFLDETGAVRAIRDMLSKADTATLAVAFWGSGAIDKIGLDKKWKSLRIVCNVDSGACNPDEIERLMNLDNVDVRTDCRLHAKVYLTPHKLVMGSSNASSNGLVVEGASITGWAEANIESGEMLVRQREELPPIKQQENTKEEFPLHEIRQMMYMLLNNLR